MAIDSGSTGIRAMLFDKEGNAIARSYEVIPLSHSNANSSEQDPIMMRDIMFSVIKQVLGKSNISAQEIAAAGLTTQRSSFCLWEKETGNPVSSVINWADVRSADVADAMNQNSKWKNIKRMAKLVGTLTGDTQMKVASMLHFTTDSVIVRLKWFLDSNPEIKKRCENGEVLFGTLDTWYIYCLTNRKVHATDYSNASSSGLYNHFTFEWNTLFMKIFKLPRGYFPTVLHTNDYFGDIDPMYFGSPIPIYAVVGDQQSSLFGHACFNKGDIKISQGSGAFLDCNIGYTPQASKRGLIPVLAWYLSNDEKPTYMIEGFVATAGTLIDWLGQGIGLSDTPDILNQLADQCEDSNGVIFIPTPSGIRYPYYNPRVKASILGLSLSTHKKHVARAVFEGLAMRIVDLVEGVGEEFRMTIPRIKIDGGVSKSDILLQIIANYSNVQLKRAQETDMTARGAAYLAGLGVKFWKNQDELLQLNSDYFTFNPKISSQERIQKRKLWKSVLQKVLKLL